MCFWYVECSEFTLIIIHSANILTDVSNEYGIESFGLIYSLYGEKKKDIYDSTEQRENPSSGVERTHLSVDVLVTLSLLLPRKKLFCETLRKNFESAEKSLTPALSKKNYITRKIC